jgi:arylsulfatase A-like enzyme/Flp pilus assembly protein TadD
MALRTLILCSLAASLAPAHAQVSTRKAQQPDVFLVTIDTLRADHVHCYGYDLIRTPALDALARDGVRFAQAFTPSPITNTSHTTILTGLQPSTHGVTDFAVPLASTHPTWAELLKKSNYHTAAFIGAVILDSKALAPGLDRGFDFYDNFPQHAQTKARWGRLERRGAVVVQHAEDWMNAHPAGPHFVWIHLYDPHDPYEPPPPYSQIYKDRLYDGEIAYADSALAGFLAYLKKRGWYDNALVILVGDHGEGLGEHHEETHGIFLYDSTTHVPLIVKLPREKDAGLTVAALVRTTDILPTVLDIVHEAAPARLDGESLSPYLADSQSSSRTAFGETDYPLRFGWAPLRSVRTETFKFIEAPRPELYDLRADPGELNNTYQPWDATVKASRAQLADARAKAPPAQSSAGAVSQNTIDELKALGYLGRADVGSSTNVPESSLLPDPKDMIDEQNLLHKAMLAVEDDRPTDARHALEKVLELDPKSPIALRQLGELDLQAGEYAKAAAYLKRARELRSDDATLAFYEGQALAKTQDLGGARDALEASLAMAPRHLPARLLLGEVYLSLRKSKAAEDQFEAAILLQPNSLEAQLGVAKAQMADCRFEDAVRQLEPLAKSYADSAELFELMSQAYSRTGKREKADQAAHRAALLGKTKKPSKDQ